jgi:hypothetical protein
MVDAFFERSLSRRKRTTLLCSIWSIPMIWNPVIFVVVCSTLSFKDLLFEFLSLTVKVRLLEWYLMLQSRKIADDSSVRCSWIQGTALRNSCKLRITKRNIGSLGPAHCYTILTIPTFIAQWAIFHSCKLK